MRVFFFLCALLLALATPAQGGLLVVNTVHEPQSLAPYCSWQADPEGRLSIEDVATGAFQDRFLPLAQGFSLKGSGPVWLRLTIIKTQPNSGGGTTPGKNNRLVVTLGQAPPGKIRVYYTVAPGPVFSKGLLHGESIAPHEPILLPEAELLPVSVYIRMNETPGPWFAPMVSRQDALQHDMLSSELLLPGLLVALTLVCLLRAIWERAQWALWSALFLGCVLLQTVLPLPGISDFFRFSDLPALLAPGLGLTILPHIARCLFRAKRTFRLQDAILYFCSLAGVALCLIPLVPGMGWMIRLFPLWPLLLVPLLPLCMNALATKRPGALAFTAVCVMPILGAGVALYALKAPSLHPLAFQGGLWGAIVGGIGLVLARVPRQAQGSAAQDTEAPLLLTETLPDKPVRLSKPLGGTGSLHINKSPYNNLPPLEAPSLNRDGVDAGEQNLTGLPEPGAFFLVEEKTPLADTGTSAKYGLKTQEADGSLQAETDLPTTDGEQEKEVLSQPVPNLSRSADNGAPSNTPPPETLPLEKGTLFSLRSLVRKAHESATFLAKARGVLLSWYVAPALPVVVRGDVQRLQDTLSLLLQSAVQSSSQGTVRLAVQENPNSDNPGDLLFAITSSDLVHSGHAVLERAWNLAAETCGTFTVESSPTKGTQIRFTARFALPLKKNLEECASDTALKMEDIAPVACANPAAATDETVSANHAALAPADKTSTLPRIVLAETTTSNRRLLVHYMSDLPYEHLNAWSNAAILSFFQAGPLELVIFDADMPEAGIAGAITTLRKAMQAAGMASPPVLCLVGHETQARRMQNAGSSFILYKPFNREDFRKSVAQAVPSLASFIGYTQKEVCDESPLQDSAPDKDPPEKQKEKGGVSDEKLPAAVDPYIAFMLSPTGEHQKRTLQKSADTPQPPPPRQEDIHGKDDLAPEAKNAVSEDAATNAPPLLPAADAPLPVADTPPALQMDSAPQQTSSTSSLHVKQNTVSPLPVSGDGGAGTFVKTPEPLSHKSIASPFAWGKNTRGSEQKTPVLPPHTETDTKSLFAQELSPPSGAHEVADTGTLTKPETFFSRDTGEQLFSLVGMEGEALPISILPLIPGISRALNDALSDALEGKKANRSAQVKEAVDRLADKAEEFGLYRLGRIARCVERAAVADDLEAVENLLADLAPVTTRYITALQAGFSSFINLER